MTTFGRYRIKKLVSSQGYLSVFLAQAEDGANVLLRVLNELVDSESPSYRRFEAEFQTLSSLCHPGILPVLDSGCVQGKVFYAAPTSPTFRPLSEILAGRTVEFDWRDAVAIGQDVLAALEYLHASDILHRDIRAGSVYYDMDSGKSLIAEFGMVRNFAFSSLTLQGVQPSSLPTLTPETIRDLPFTPATDLYLLGNLVYEVLAGESAIRLDFAYPGLVGRREGIPPGLDPILARALAPEPKDRFPSAREFRLALAGLSSG